MAAFDTQSAPVHVCAIAYGPDDRASLDALLGGLAVLDNLCLVLIGAAEGVGLPVDWDAADMTDAFQPVARRILLGAADAETVFDDMAQRFGPQSIAVQLGHAPGAAEELGLIEAGGMTLVEGSGNEPSQTADMTAPVEVLCETIIALCRRAAKRPTRVAPLSPQETREVCELLREATGHDFKHYKETTLSRRILRRIHIQHCDTFADYLTLLKASGDEPRALMRDMLIGVTAFFRDVDAFAALNAKVIDPLLSPENPGTVRLWLAGCSTGPEAYTLAMLVRERLEATVQDREVQIFATDLDERALNVARKGIYPAAMVDRLPAERVARHFTRVGARYQVNKAVRQMIVFSRHNLIADPPFSKMDLIVCRNVMIYLGAHLQKKLMSVFHYALADNGHLFLGSSEAVTGHGDLFRVIDNRARIAQRKDVGARTATPRQPRANGAVAWQTHAVGPEQNLAAISQRIVLDEFAPPYLIATEDGQITYTSARVGAFLEVPEGQFMNSLIRVVRPGIRTGVRTAWAAALRTRRKSVHEGLTVSADHDRRRTRIVVQPMPDLGEDAGTYMVVFFDLGQVADSDTLLSSSPDSERLFADLEAELFHAREELEHSVQDLEGANEELKSSNEELLSMNEELQSANEELESSKDQIERSNTALEDANTDLVNLLSSTQIATIFLDAVGNLRRFTPAASNFYNIIQADIGRPLVHFTHLFSDLPPMPEPGTLDMVHEAEALRADGRTFLRRVTPYTTESGASSGIVVTFIDITAAKQAEDRIRKSAAQLRVVTETAPAMIARIDADLRYTFVNSAFAQFYDSNVDDLVGQPMATVMTAASLAQARPHIRAVLSGETVSYDIEVQKPDGPIYLTVNHAPEFGDDDRVTGFVSAIIDVTQSTITERNLLASEAQFRASQQAAPQGFILLRSMRDTVGQIEDFLVDYVNDAGLRLSGRNVNAVLGQRLLDVFPENRTQGLFDRYVGVAESGELIRVETPYIVDGKTRWFEITAVQVDDGVAVAWDDISVRKAQERQIADNAQRLRRILNSVVAFVGALTPDGILTEANQPALDIANLAREDVISKPLWEAYWWSHDPEVQAKLKGAVELAAAGTASRYDVKIRVSPEQYLFIDFQLAPLFDDQGRVVELIASAVDITERLHAEDAVFRSAEQMSRTLDGVETLVGLLHGDGRVSDLNATALEQLGAAKSDLLGQHFAEMPWWRSLPEQSDQVRRMMTLAMDGTNCREDLRFRAPDGTLRWLDFTLAPVQGTDGENSGFVWSGNDITDRRASEQALADSRERLRIATRAAHLGTFDLDTATGIVNWDARASEILGLSERQTSLDDFIALLDENDREAMQRTIANGLNPALDLRNQSIVYRVKQADGGLVWVEAHASFWLDGSAKVVGTIQDITDRKRAQDRQELLLHELNHRVKNSLATIQAIASHTLRHAESPEAFRTSFGGRLAAIAAAHDILVGNEDSGADLHQLFQSQIGAYASIEHGQVVLSGPSVKLGPTVAHSLGLVLHELATNAAKYGALSTEAGVLSISWALLERQGRTCVRIDWAERNGPPVTPPTRRGFGSRLIDMTLTHTLDGEVQLHYEPKGFEAQLLIQLVADNDL